MKKVEYSQVTRRKLKDLRKRLTETFGDEVSRKSLKKITDAAKGLSTFERKGISISSVYDIDCDYRYLYISHNYLFYRIEKSQIIVVDIFDEREDFIFKLFGITTLSENSFNYWEE